MEVVDSFGEWLQRRRRALDLTRVELARCAGCSVSALRKIETGERRPSKQLAELLADCLRIRPEERTTFMRVARGELRSDRLTPPAFALVPEHERPVRLNNLPVPATPLIGRASELGALGQLLRDSQCRLLTIVGPGGVGKTRVAIEAASGSAGNFSDGVCFVSLASLSAPELIVSTIADALGVKVLSSADPAAQLLNYLRGKTLLLLLDSAEHLLPGLGFVSQFLQRAPAVKVLATSRQRLELQGEWAFELQGLPVPPVGQEHDLTDYSAVALFVQVARRMRAGMDLAEKDQLAVGHISRLLEGMPLGIEMAAAWVGMLSCEEIAQEIERSLDFLASSRRDIPERHRSLRAVFDHSYRLLSDEERAVLRQLSVFQGGFDRQAAEQVAGASLSLLMALVHKSLLHRSEAGRYDLHELVRQYARGWLSEMPEELEAVSDRHSVYYADLVQRLEPDLKGEGQSGALAHISTEIDNVRLAWQRAVTRGQVGIMAGPIRSLWVFYEIRGWFREAEAFFRWAIEELERAVGTGATGEPALVVVREHLRANQGWFCLKLGKLEEAGRLLLPSLTVLRACGAERELVDALYFVGVWEWMGGEYAAARAHFAEELAMATHLGDRWDMALARGNLALATQSMGEYEEAETHWQATLAAVRALGDQRLVASALQFIGRLKVVLGAYDEARVYLQEALLLSGPIGDRWIHGLALGQLGQVARALGEGEEAARWFRDSLTLVREIGEGWSTLQALNGLGETTLELGQFDASHSTYCEALSLAMQMRALPQALSALLGLANWLAHKGETEEALVYVLVVRQHPATSQDSRDRAEQLRGEWEARLASVQIEAAQARAESASLDELARELLRCP